MPLLYYWYLCLDKFDSFVRAFSKTNCFLSILHLSSCTVRHKIVYFFSSIIICANGKQRPKLKWSPVVFWKRLTKLNNATVKAIRYTKVVCARERTWRILLTVPQNLDKRWITCGVWNSFISKSALCRVHYEEYLCQWKMWIGQLLILC